MSTLPNCPKCQSEYTYQDGDLLIYPECSHEWSKSAVTNIDGIGAMKLKSEFVKKA